ncbi:hypothetical protein BUALT_Bualt01G0081700 [Buddleja alternifolia]|uniref:RWP-RK domain-containing protein n=1 Tax=Buddleja alternifolia TaxID=168488 RepID=A0AAV6YDX9_9LAMI|nr:hypothetical protein BUALT_Bualt01G0081700 [Buddleja alternifolia]
MVSRELSLVKLDNQNEVDCLFFEDQPPLGTWEQQFSYTDGFNLDVPNSFEFEPIPLAYQMSRTSQIELNDFEEIAGDLGLWDLELPSIHNDDVNIDVDNPMSVKNMLNDHIFDRNEDIGTLMYDSSVAINTNQHQEELSVLKRNGRYKSTALQLEEIQRYFDVPITQAAKELNVGLTVLKKRCRELNITRWPHRKIKSLKSLIHNVKELGLTNEIEMLEEHKRMVERVPEMELTERTKKLRQACFKANYKKRKSLHQAALA